MDRATFTAEYRKARELYRATIAADRSGDKAASAAAEEAWSSFAQARAYVPPGARFSWNPAAWCRMKARTGPTLIALSAAILRRRRHGYPESPADRIEAREYLTRHGIGPGHWNTGPLPLP